jgi:hypothetical protein
MAFHRMLSNTRLFASLSMYATCVDDHIISMVYSDGVLQDYATDGTDRKDVFFYQVSHSAQRN